MNLFFTFFISLISLFYVGLAPTPEHTDDQSPEVSIFSEEVPPFSNCPASPYPTIVQQPNNTTLTVIGKGNMVNHWTETTDGYTVVLNKGIYEYAKKLNGELVATGVAAHDPLNRNASEQAFLSGISKSTKPNLNPLNQAILNQVRGRLMRKTFPSTGNIRVLALLIDYPNLQQTYPASDFDSLLYAANYRSGDGSFKYFYETSSDSILTIDVDVRGWYRAANNYLYYSRDSGYDRAADLVREAVDAAELAGVNFANYDNDNNGNVDGILAVHSGPGAEQGARTQYIWSHRWVLAGGNLGAVTYDGKFINDYMINPETRIAGANQNLVGIGVFCHEFGHNLGLPDLYDTDNSNGDSEGIGNWCLMAGGTWLGGEHRPANHSAWCRVELNWATPTLLSIGNSSAHSMQPSVNDPNEIYRINTSLSNEYFLLENRQKIGLDVELPGEGLAVWHINTNKTLAPGNGVNADENLKGVDLEEADGLNDLDNEVNRGDNGDLFPGSTTNRTFDSTSSPNSRTYTNANTGLQLRNITESGNLVTFDFGPPITSTCTGNTNLTAASGTFDDGSGSSSQYANNLNCSWLIQVASGPINLSFNRFDLDTSGDTLYLYDGANNAATLIGKYTDASLPSAAVSTGNDLFIEFVTDGLTASLGWELSYTSTPPSITCSGSTSLTAANGSFDDGSGTANYSNNLNCSWLIQPSGSPTVITLDFNSMNLQNFGDFVRVYDGTNSSGTPLGILTFSNTGNTFRAFSGSMFIQFNTGSSGTAAGWDATYSSANSFCIPNDTLTTTSGFIDDGTPIGVPYLNNTSCSWIIQPPVANQSIRFNFFRIVTELGSDSVTFYDGTSTSDPILGSFSGNLLPNAIISSGPEMLITFNTNGSVSADGFRGAYLTVPSPSCAGLTTFTSATGTFDDGSGPSANYSDNSNCSWLIQPPGAITIDLSFNSFRTEVGFDFLDVYDGTNNLGTLLGSFSGTAIPSTLQASSGSMYLEFRSDGSVNDDGWEVSYTSSNTANLTASPDTITLNAALGSQSPFNVSSNTSWNVTDNSAWMLTNPLNGNLNQSVNVIAVQPNIGPVRFGEVYVTDLANTTSDTVVVRQLSSGRFLDAQPDTLFYLASPAGSQNAIIQSNVNWNLSSPDSWITIGTSSGSNNGSSAISVNTNTGAARVGLIIASGNFGVNNDTIFVSQAAAGGPILSANPDTLVVGSALGSTAQINLNANTPWQANTQNPQFSLNQFNGNSTATITVTANSENFLSNPVYSYAAFRDAGNALFDTVVIEQSGINPTLSLNPSVITLGQAANSIDSSFLSSNTQWTLENTFPLPSFFGILTGGGGGFSGLKDDTIRITTISANTSVNPRNGYLAFVDASGTVRDTLFIIQSGTGPALDASPDTLFLNGLLGSNGSINLIANGNWTAVEGDVWLSSSANSGSGSANLTINANSANTAAAARVSFIAFADAAQSLNDTVVVVQDTIRQTLSAMPDTVVLGANSGAVGMINVNSTINWTANPSANWFNLSQSNGNGNAMITVSSNSANQNFTDRFANVIFTDNNNVNNADTVVIQQEGSALILNVNPLAVNLNSTSGSFDVLSITSNTNWTVSNPVSWLSLSANNGNGNSNLTVTANSDNLSGSPRLANLTLSASGVPDVIVSITQIDGTSPNFVFSRDTAFVDFVQGSITNFSVLANQASWTLSESTPWLLLNPASGSGTSSVTALAASRNAFGNFRYGTVVGSAQGFSNDTIVIAQRPSSILFQAAPSVVSLGSDSSNTVTFNISSNLLSWSLSESSNWMEVSPDTGGFTQQIEVRAIEDNNTGAIRSDIITILSPPQVPLTVTVSQDTLRAIGLNENQNTADISVYPNPTRDMVMIEGYGIERMDLSKFQVYSANGRLLEVNFVRRAPTQVSLDLSSQAVGVYYLRYLHQDGILSKKIILLD